MKRLTVGVSLALILAGTLLTFGCAKHRPGATTSGTPAVRVDVAGNGAAEYSAAEYSAAEYSNGMSSNGASTLAPYADMSPVVVALTGPGGADAYDDSGTADPVGRRAVRPEEYQRVSALRGVHFAFDRHDVSADQRHVLDENAAWMRTHPGSLILIEGHTDERGTDQYNLSLGERRAMSARNYLVAQGVSPKQITTISYGEERPACREHRESCWSRNRWAHFLVKMQ